MPSDKQENAMTVKTLKKTDKTRLDWLDNNTANLLWLGGARDGQCEIIGQTPKRLIPGFGYSAREAIDDAMEKKK